MSQRSSLNVKAINNEFEVLAKHLGIADDNDQERSKIQVLERKGGFCQFTYDGWIYSVAKKLLKGSETAYEFNSNWYAIQKREQVKIKKREIPRLDYILSGQSMEVAFEVAHKRWPVENLSYVGTDRKTFQHYFQEFGNPEPLILG
jgi:hypothetical protein